MQLDRRPIGRAKHGGSSWERLAGGIKLEASRRKRQARHAKVKEKMETSHRIKLDLSVMKRKAASVKLKARSSSLKLEALRREGGGIAGSVNLNAPG